MAGKQLGKFRQWAGEVISSRDKTTVTDEFKELEKDVELRKDGIQRLTFASEGYHKYLSKKKHNEGLDDPEKLLPVDALGIVMITHGEQFGDDSAFGTSLVKLGRAHCKIATLQEAYALTFQDTFMNSMQKFADEIKEYEHMRKKLESRRLSYDAAMTKAEKLSNSKKDKDREDAEEEMERAKQRYEETSEDIRAHIQSIQENEIDQLRELTAFLDLELNFVEQYASVLKEVKSDWSGPSNVSAKRRPGPFHVPKERPPMSRSTSMRSAGSRPPSRPPSRPQSRAAQSAISSDASDDDGEPPSAPPSRRGSMHHRSDSISSKISRAASRSSRKRSDSGVAKEEKEKEKRMSVAGWASTAMGSVTGRSKKNKDKFSALQDNEDTSHDDDEGRRSVSKSPSRPSLIRRASNSKDGLTSSPQLPPRILKPPSQQEKKVVRAIYDFHGSTDELPFKAGDEIVVLSEVLDDWWMGELNGKKGLFPTSFTQPVSKRPSIPARNNSGPYKNNNSHSSDGEESYDDDADDLHEAFQHKPLAPAVHSSPFLAADAGSITTSEDEEEQKIFPSFSRRGNESPPDLPGRRPPSATPVMRRSTTENNATRKAPPPPPPPRRSHTSNLSLTPPSIPLRRPASSTSSLQPHSSSSSAGGVDHYDASPFDSAADLAVESESGCGAFKQNPFKPKGMCNNCFQMHH